MEMSTSGYYCQTCGSWVVYGTFHICQIVPATSTSNFCVCCPQVQKLNHLIERLEELLKNMEKKQ
jgi:hypothetical protein